LKSKAKIIADEKGINLVTASSEFHGSQMIAEYSQNPKQYINDDENIIEKNQSLSRKRRDVEELPSTPPNKIRNIKRQTDPSEEISVNQDHGDELGSNSPLNDEFVKEKDYSDPESDTSTEFFNDDNDDDPDYVYSSGSSSCEETKVTKSARKLDSDEEISLANQDHDDNNESTNEPESRSPIYDEFVKEMCVSSDTSGIEYVNDDNDDDSDCSESSSCEETKVTKSARKLNSDEETPSVSPAKRTKLNEDTTPDIVSGLNESASFDRGSEIMKREQLLILSSLFKKLMRSRYQLLSVPLMKTFGKNGN